MTKGQILEKLDEQQCIYAFMYGHRNSGRVVQIYKKELKIKGLDVGNPYFYFEWGWPGPDFDVYYFDDYGKVWAFSAEELV